MKKMKKPGPPKTGLKRPIQFLFKMNRKEFEYVNRASVELGISFSEFIRELIFTRGWKIYLIHLREIQGSNIPSTEWKKVRGK